MSTSKDITSLQKYKLACNVYKRVERRDYKVNATSYSWKELDNICPVHKHHIMPKALFPDLAEDKDNIVEVPRYVHAVLHYWLWQGLAEHNDPRAKRYAGCADEILAFNADNKGPLVGKEAFAELAEETWRRVVKSSKFNRGSYYCEKAKFRYKYGFSVDCLKHERDFLKRTRQVPSGNVKKDISVEEGTFWRDWLLQQNGMLASIWEVNDDMCRELQQKFEPDILFTSDEEIESIEAAVADA